MRTSLSSPGERRRTGTRTRDVGELVEGDEVISILFHPLDFVKAVFGKMS
jgi:hypothetical protein